MCGLAQAVDPVFLLQSNIHGWTRGDIGSSGADGSLGILYCNISVNTKIGSGQQRDLAGLVGAVQSRPAEIAKW